MELSEDKKQETSLFFWQLNYIYDQIKMADSKIGLLCGVFGAILAVLLSQAQFINQYIYSNINIFYKSILTLLILILLLIIFLFYIILVNTIKPRLQLKVEEYKDFENPIFFKHVSNMQYDKFINTSLEDRINGLKKQIYLNSHIVTKKYQFIQYAYVLIPFALLLLVILFCFLYGSKIIISKG